jgi:DNA-binding response OmpR family regulator
MDDSQGRLLIVEDDSALRRSLRTTLDVIGFDVGEASNGEESLVRLRMVDYEAVLLDINMLDPVRHRVERAGIEIHLTPREFDVLRLLMSHAGRPITYARLISSLGVSGFGSERAYLRVLIGQVRKKLEDDAANPTYILTDSYIGYRFREPSPADYS